MSRDSLKQAAAVLFTAAVFTGTVVAEPVTDRNWSVTSPAGRTELAVRGTDDGGLKYRVLLNRDGKPTPVVQWSALGLVTRMFEAAKIQLEATDSDFSSSLKFLSAQRGEGEDAFVMLTGKRRENRAAYHQLTLSFKDAETGRLLDVDARAYDDGVAFRYRLPGESLLHHQLVAEHTEFAFDEAGRHWGQPYDFVTIYHPSYETLYGDRPVGTTVPEDAGTGWGFPSLFELDKAWVLLHEAGLDETFHGSHLKPEAPGGVYSVAPPLPDSAAGFGRSIAASTLPWTLPWRVMVIGDNAGDILESNLTFALAPPSKVEDTDWIQPGVSSWSWWSDHASSRDQKTLESFIDLAADMGWRYSLMDADWNRIGEGVMEELVAYADKQGVGLLFWYNSGGRHNFIPLQPRNRLYERERRRAEFAKLAELGVKGIKVDFFQSDKQDIIEHYLDILEDAAEFELLVVFHGSTIPRGWARTWPNLMSMEAVRGAEFYTFSAETRYGSNAPRQNTILPFTRNVVGSMDFTPVSFSHQAVKRYTSDAHEAALAVIFESGIQHLSDNVKTFRALPAPYKRYFGGLPTAWDETRYLAGSPGEHVALARRKDKRWYIAGINGEDAEKRLVLDVNGLDGIGNDGLLLFDGEQGLDSRPVEYDGGKIEVSMKAYGGFSIVPESTTTPPAD